MLLSALHRLIYTYYCDTMSQCQLRSASKLAKTLLLTSPLYYATFALPLLLSPNGWHCNEIWLYRYWFAILSPSFIKNAVQHIPVAGLIQFGDFEVEPSSLLRCLCDQLPDQGRLSEGILSMQSVSFRICKKFFGHLQMVEGRVCLHIPWTAFSPQQSCGQWWWNNKYHFVIIYLILKSFIYAAKCITHTNLYYCKNF